jgi:hypothetical protein
LLAPLANPVVSGDALHWEPRYQRRHRANPPRQWLGDLGR